jgi:hypothetical protein
MSQNTFRQRVLSLAAMLVTSVQLLTLQDRCRATRAADRHDRWQRIRRVHARSLGAAENNG